MGPCTASSCCCQARNLPWAPIEVPTPHAAARPVICHGPLYTPPHAAASRSRVCHGSLYGPPIAAVSIATLCHVPLSGLLTLLVGFHFVIGCCMVLPLLLPATPPHTLWLHTLVLAPVTAQMSEVCGDSKIDGTHLHVILTDSIISLPSRLQGHLN
ncbi:unnamed protein product [Staurois parvus]|uniref:Uncharacterized protein n=1 Tax=Staurois parvus TaxID=386267 RepID=A0ABN9BMD7_9NEOB|nr:unnamed protein product [Staurois parvus]